jgi:hypothetical protein
MGAINVTRWPSGRPEPTRCHSGIGVDFRRTGVTEYWRSGIPLVDFDIGRPDHLAPLLGFGGDESSEIGGRARKRRRTQIGEPRFYVGFGKSNVYLLVQLVDDFGGVFLGAATPNQLLASKPGRNSLTVGTPGRIHQGERDGCCQDRLHSISPGQSDERGG